MEKYIYDQNNGLWYELQGDYYIPCLTLEGNAPPHGVWGRKRFQHLRESHEGVYTGLLISGKLNSHLVEVDAQAAEMFDRLVQQMAAQQGVNEQLKAKDQMAWVQRMNNIRDAAEEIVNGGDLCMIEKYIKALEKYALKDPAVTLGGESVLGILYECYNENHPYGNNQIKANFNELYRQTNGMELREMLQLSLKLIKVMESPDSMTFSNRLN